MNTISEIREATIDDFDQIIQLERKCFPGHLAYSSDQLYYLLTKAHRTFLVETYDKILRGFIIVLIRQGSSVAGLETVNVDPDYHNQGIGTRLLHAAEEEMKKHKIKTVRLEVSPGNHAALNLYKNEGYTIISRIKNYYTYNHQHSRDALRMIKELSP